MSGHKRTRSYSASDIVPNARSRTQSNPHLEEEDMLPPDLSPDAEEFIPLMLKLGITGMEPMDPSRSPSPLTPLGLEGEEESEEEEEGDEGDMPRSETPETKMPNVHIRNPKNGYRINRGEDLSGPSPENKFKWPRGTMRQLNVTERHVRLSVNNAIYQLWPNLVAEPKRAERHLHSLVDPCAFWHRALRQVFTFKISEWMNSADESQRRADSNKGGMANVALALFNEIEKEVEEFTPFQSPLLDGFYGSFKGIIGQKEADRSPIPHSLKLAIKESDKLHDDISKALKLGKDCSKQARWIGLNRFNEKNRSTQMRKHMVEMESLRKKGIKNGALAKKGNDVLILGEDWNRVCAPKQSGKMLSFVFWDNSDSNQKPSWDNQFGAIVYNPQALNPSFSARDSGILKAECQRIYENVKSKTAVPRGIADQGVMVKHSGAHSTYGVLNEPGVNVEKVTSAKPTLRIQRRIQNQRQMRIELERETSAIQACSFAFMMGFLPHLAYKQYFEARHYHLINDLGRPNVTSFAAYAYSAGPHIDKDICVSHGWIVSRSEEINRRESNFVYSDYQLIVELSHDSHWFWNAANDAHGTTSNNLAMSKPDKWRDYITGKPDAAQWSYVQTIPKAVANASIKQPRVDVW